MKAHVCFAIGILAGACGGAAVPSDGGGDAAGVSAPLQVATWWTSPSETEALQRFVAAFRADHPTTTVELMTVGNDPAARRLAYQTIDWDIGQEVAVHIQENFALGGGQYTAVDLHTVPELTAVLDTVTPAFLTSLTFDGQLLGFPTDSHRENTLHYALAYTTTPPATLAELRATCDAYVAGGRTGPAPLALAAQDWIVRILFEAMLPADVLSGTAADPMPAFAAAADVIEHFAQNDCFFMADSWDAAAQALIDGTAGMYVHGDWARGYLVQSGWQAGTDFNVTPAPGSEGAYYYGVDSFVVRRDSVRRDLAIEFAQTALSPAAQIEFSRVKGSAPVVRIDNPDAQIADAALRATYQQLVDAQAAGSFVPVPSWLADHGALLMPLLDGTRTAPQVATDMAAVYP